MQTLQKRMWKFLTICCISMWSSFFNFLLLLSVVLLVFLSTRFSYWSLDVYSFLFGVSDDQTISHTQKWIGSKKRRYEEGKEMNGWEWNQSFTYDVVSISLADIWRRNIIPTEDFYWSESVSYGSIGSKLSSFKWI